VTKLLTRDEAQRIAANIAKAAGAFALTQGVGRLEKTPAEAGVSFA
jgi:hypothetical protein